MKIELFGSRILVLCDALVEQIGKIILPTKHSERTRLATVVVVGDGVENYKPGDKVMISWYTGVNVHLSGKDLFGVPVDEDKHRLVMESEILGKLTD